MAYLKQPFTYVLNYLANYKFHTQRLLFHEKLILPHLSLGYTQAFPQSQLALVHYKGSVLLHTVWYSLFEFLLVKSSISINNKIPIIKGINNCSGKILSKLEIMTKFYRFYDIVLAINPANIKEINLNERKINMNTPIKHSGVRYLIGDT